MYVDLHSHSSASDGTLTPADLVAKAVECRLTALALTDHDTQSGIDEARAAAEMSNIDLIPGTELSLEYPHGGMHLVVLWLEPGPGPLQDQLMSLQAGRADRNRMIIKKLQEHGMDIEMEEVEAEAGLGTVGRPHIAAVMMEKGIVEDMRTAFDHWLGNDKPAYVSRKRLNPEDAIRLARQSGAVPILAHPHTLNIHRADEMASLLDRLREAGLVGLESVYSSYRRHERDGYSSLARRFGLVPSGGSDFHGSYKPGLQLGSGYGDLAVSAGIMDELRTYARTS